MNPIQAADLKKAEAMRGVEFTADGMQHRITDAWFAEYACVVLVEVRIWFRPGRSSVEILTLDELDVRMGSEQR